VHLNATGGIAHRPAIRRELKKRVAQLAAEEGRLMCTSVSEPASSSLMPVAFVPSVQARPLCPVDIGCTARSSSPRCSRRASDYAYLHAHPGARPESRGRDRSARSHQELAVGTAVQRVARHAVISGGVHSLLRNAGLEIKLRDATPAPITPPNSDSSAGMIGLLHRTRFRVTLLLRLIVP
jgi:hypothetical protein